MSLVAWSSRSTDFLCHGQTVLTLGQSDEMAFGISGYVVSFPFRCFSREGRFLVILLIVSCTTCDSDPTRSEAVVGTSETGKWR